jgi:hypothetical protein
MLVALLGGCATRSVAGNAGGDAPPAIQPAAMSPDPVTSQLPPAIARPEERFDARFQVPPLPPDVPVTRWQQFCWTGVEAWSQQHLSDAGAQGWELVGVTVGVTSNVAIPRTEGYGIRERITSEVVQGGQIWVTCFKRPLVAAPPSR